VAPLVFFLHLFWKRTFDDQWHIFTGWVPLLSHNPHCESTEGKFRKLNWEYRPQPVDGPHAFWATVYKMVRPMLSDVVCLSLLSCL